MLAFYNFLMATNSGGFFDLFNKLGIKFFIRLAIDLSTIYLLVNVIYVI